MARENERGLADERLASGVPTDGAVQELIMRPVDSPTRPCPSQVALSAEGVTKRFFRKGRDQGRFFDAVSDVSLGVSSGELVALMGRSGSGKSTLLNMLAGLLAPDQGTVRLCGQGLYELGDRELSRLRNECVGVVPQGQTPIHSLTVLENVTLPFLMYREDDGDVSRRAMALLERMEIAQLADSYPSELSGGELRRMAIARALVNEPQVVLADEPTGDLDDQSTRVVLQTLREVAERGSAVLVVTHEREAEGYASRVLRMDAGKIAG